MKILDRIPPIRFLLNSETGMGLFGKCVLMLVIPYVYLLLCGVIFDYLLKWYFMTTFIFVSLILFYLVALVLIGIAIGRFMGKKKTGRK